MPDFILHVPDYVHKSSLRAREIVNKALDKAIGRGIVTLTEYEQPTILVSNATPAEIEHLMQAWKVANTNRVKILSVGDLK